MTLANNNPSSAQRVMAWIKRLADRFNEFMHGREGGLTTSQRDNLTRVVGNLAATMKDGKGRSIFGVYRNGTEIRLAKGQFLPAVSFSASGKNVLDNSENVEIIKLKKRIRRLRKRRKERCLQGMYLKSHSNELRAVFEQMLRGQNE